MTMPVQPTIASLMFRGMSIRLRNVNRALDAAPRRVATPGHISLRVSQIFGICLHQRAGALYGSERNSKEGRLHIRARLREIVHGERSWNGTPP